jgi:DNA polymerase-3 subunit epsilon
MNLTQYPDNDYVRGLVYQYAEKNPHLKLGFSGL